MAEYIERYKILGYMDLVVIHARGVAGNDSILKKVTDIVENMRDLVAEAPAADVVPVVHGRWEIKTDDYDCEYAKCSACGEEFYDANEDTIDITFNYCPNCGARMDGE